METETNLYLNAPVSALLLFELEKISPLDEHPPVPWYALKNIYRNCDSPVRNSGTVGNVRPQKISPRVAAENSGNVYILSKCHLFWEHLYVYFEKLKVIYYACPLQSIVF
jgi:hypothetical protein